MQTFLASLDKLEALAKHANGLDLGSVKARFPMPLFSGTLAQWFELMPSHSRRHLWQATSFNQLPKVKGISGFNMIRLLRLLKPKENGQ